MFIIRCKASSAMRIHCCGRTFFGSTPHASVKLPYLQLPSKSETHLWYVLPDEVKSDCLLNEYLDLLPPCEKKTVLSMDEQIRKRTLLARTLVRTTIARYQINSEVSPRSLKFKKNVYGKPEVDWQLKDEWCPPPLHFNISHTSSLIVCGITVNAPIGIDVEEKQRKIKNNILSFARRFFSPYEVNLLASMSEPEFQQKEFIKLWTLKEAYVKALGRGFSATPFSTFTIHMKAGNLDSKVFKTPSSEWQREGKWTGNNWDKSIEGRRDESVKGDWTCAKRIGTAKVSEIDVAPHGDHEVLLRNWQFSLLDLVGTHYAAICTGVDSSSGGGPKAMNIRAWRTIPLVEDENVSGTDAVVKLSA